MPRVPFEPAAFAMAWDSSNTITPSIAVALFLLVTPGQPGDDLIETRGLALAGRRAQRGVGREQDAFILRYLRPLPVTGKRDHVLLAAPERGPVPAGVLEQVGGGREPERPAPSAEPVVEDDRRDLAALAAPGAVAQHPATTEPDLRRERLTVLGSGCIDAHPRRSLPCSGGPSPSRRRSCSGRRDDGCGPRPRGRRSRSGRPITNPR